MLIAPRLFLNPNAECEYKPSIRLKLSLSQNSGELPEVTCKNGATTLSIMTLSIMTLSIISLSIMALSIMIFNIIAPNALAKGYYAECHN